LRLEFVAAGAQLLTAGGDGLLKLWTIKSSECVTTLDAHERKIWALGGMSNTNKNFVLSPIY
jgi:U3 small nucleolar RNA-associated protein 13